MKNKVIVLVCVLLVATFGCFALHKAMDVKIAQEKQKQSLVSSDYFHQEMTEQQQDSNERYSQLCTQTVSFYSLLTDAQKKTVTKPTCNLGVIE